VAGVVLYWEMHAEAACSVEEVANYRHALRPLVDVCGRLAAEGFGAQQLRQVQHHMATLWCRNVVNRSVVRTRTVWRWAEMEGLVPPGTWSALRAVPPLGRPRQGVRETGRVQPVEWWRLARTAYLGATHEGLRRLILLGWWTGARPNELAGLRAGMIERGEGLWRADLAEHKTAWRGHGRTIFFGPEGQALLAGVLDTLASDALVCPDGKGGPYNRRSLYQAVYRACDRAGVERWHPYRWRHSFKQRVSRELGPEAARVLMGQRSLSTTERYAVGVDQHLAAQAARKAG
jgi:integrase